MAAIELVAGDLLDQKVDVIVNAANSSLLGGGGVDGAIHRDGGPEILAEFGPQYLTTEDRSALLADCHRNSLAVAAGLGAETVAFPAISTGIYGWPYDSAALIALRAAAGELGIG